MKNQLGKNVKRLVVNSTSTALIFVIYNISHDKKNMDHLVSMKYEVMISGLPLFPALAKSSFSIEEDAKSYHDDDKWKT